MNDCRDRLWRQLADFENWPAWSQDIKSIERRESDSPGRGSLLSFGIRSNSQQWQISHWNPGKRLDLICQLSNRAIAYRFFLTGSNDDQVIEFRFEVETDYSGVGRLLNIFPDNLERQRAKRLFDDFCSSIVN